MEALQKRCLWCLNYRVVEDDCSLDECNYEQAVRVRAKVRNRRKGKDAFRDLLGTHVDDGVLLRPRKYREWI